MRVAIAPGYTGSALGLAGTGALALWPDQAWIGVGLLADGAFVFLSGVRIEGWSIEVRPLLWATRAKQTADNVAPNVIEALGADNPRHTSLAPLRELTDAEKADCKETLRAFANFIVQVVTPLREDARWLGTAPQHLPPPADELPALRDQAREAQRQFNVLAASNKYNLTLMGLDLGQLEIRLRDLGDAIARFGLICGFSTAAQTRNSMEKSTNGGVQPIARLVSLKTR